MRVIELIPGEDLMGCMVVVEKTRIRRTHLPLEPRSSGAER